MESDEVLKRIIMLTLLLLATGIFDNSTRALALITALILIITIILLSMTQIDGLSIFIPEMLLERAVWVVVFICAILIFAVRLLSY